MKSEAHLRRRLKRRCADPDATSDEEEDNDLASAKNEPPPIKIEGHRGNSWIFLKTVEQVKDVEEFCSKQRMRMCLTGQSYKTSRFNYNCMNRPESKGGCRMMLLIQQSEDGELFHIYTPIGIEHNHQLTDGDLKGNKCRLSKTTDPINITEVDKQLNSSFSFTDITFKPKNVVEQKGTFEFKASGTERNTLNVVDESKIESTSVIQRNGENKPASEKGPSTSDKQKMPPPHNNPNAKWRLLGTLNVEPKFDLDAVARQHGVRTGTVGERRIILHCDKHSSKQGEECAFRMQLIKGIEGEGGWKMYGRGVHIDMSESEKPNEEPKRPSHSNHYKDIRGSIWSFVRFVHSDNELERLRRDSGVVRSTAASRNFRCIRSQKHLCTYKMLVLIGGEGNELGAGVRAVYERGTHNHPVVPVSSMRKASTDSSTSVPVTLTAHTVVSDVQSTSADAIPNDKIPNSAIGKANKVALSRKRLALIRKRRGMRHNQEMGGKMPKLSSSQSDGRGAVVMKKEQLPNLTEGASGVASPSNQLPSINGQGIAGNGQHTSNGAPLTPGPVPPPASFKLMQLRDKIAQIALELGLNAREEFGCIIITSALVSGHAGRYLVFCEEGDKIEINLFVNEILSGPTIVWKKLDIPQFLRAVHGQMHEFFLSPS